MSQYRAIVIKFPSVVREKMLAEQMITSAQPTAQDAKMMYLMKAWYKFIEPLAEQNYNCGKCVANILSNYRQLLTEFETLHHEEEVLNQL